MADEKMKVTVMECGRVLLPAPGIYRDDSRKYPWAMLKATNSMEDLLDLPVFCFLVQTPDGKNILFDTGWHSEVREHRWRDLAPVNLCDTPILPKGQCVNERLAALGLAPEDLDYVVLSHMHIDHAGGMRDVKGAKHFVASTPEYKAARRGGLTAYRRRHWRGLKVETYDFDKTGFGPKNKYYDLLGDGSVLMVWMPGHTPGANAMVIRHDGKELILIGDSAYSKKSWYDGVVPGIMTDETNIRNTFSWLKHEYETNPNLLGIISAHDSDVAQREFIF